MGGSMGQKISIYYSSQLTALGNEHDPSLPASTYQGVEIVFTVPDLTEIYLHQQGSFTCRPCHHGL